MNVWNPPVSSCSSRRRTRWSIRCLRLVDVAVEHGGVGVQAQPVGRPVDVEPALGRGLGAADLLADFGMEDLGAAAGQAAEPGLDQLLEHRFDRLPRDLAEPLDLDGRVGLDVDLGRGFLDPAHDVEVVAERQLVVQAADDVQLGGPAGAGLPGALDDLVAVHHVGPVFAQVGPERAEVAGVDADVGRVDVRIHVVVREVAVVSLAHQVGHRAQGEQVVRRLERQAILEAQPLAGLDLIADRIQTVGRCLTS